MALSLDDKLLGEKTHYYCSSSEEDDEDEDEDYDTGREVAEGNPGAVVVDPRESSVPEPPVRDYEGRCTNVGILL
jgi:hypothetical protein